MAILHSHLAFAPWMQPAGRRLPGVMPLDPKGWLLVDDAFAAQMAERARLLATRPQDVLGALPEAAGPARELLGMVLDELPLHGFKVKGQSVLRPDGIRIEADFTRPLWSLGQLMQSDACILQKPDGAAEHMLTGAVLCFPSSWTLAEKLGRPMQRIHAPVDSYDSQMGARVQRMFDAIRPGQPLWRANLLRYTDPALYQPQPECAPREKSLKGAYIRSERQVIMRLPQSGAVVFLIHTVVVQLDALTPAQATALDAMSA